MIDMSWYKPWLSHQFEALPYSLRKLHVGGDLLPKKPCLDDLFQTIHAYTQGYPGVSIDEIVEHLQKIGVFDDSTRLLGAQILLIFAILGWQSMLYQPAFNVCSTDQLAIHQEPGQPRSGLVFDVYKISADLSDRPLWVVLKAFGNLLPARALKLTQIASKASKASKFASSWLPLYPVETNAYLLYNLLRVRIRWVESLALHLDYDKSSRTLSLFSYPSFCLHMLLSEGPIYAFGSIVEDDIDPRANRDDISQFLREVLLSYRLLFGQSAKSRKLFRQIFKPSDNNGRHYVDSLLPHICTKKRISSTSIPEDRSVYFAARDFPILYERIELIAKELKESRPNSLGNLIRDRRDTLQFWTFWLVAIFGGTSLFLSAVQVVLQGVQLLQG